MDFAATRAPRPIMIGDATVAFGPLVVPSYSSKALPRIPVKKIIDATAGYIAGAVLISAYDAAHNEVDPKVFGAQMIIVDSGGYEKLVDDEGKVRGGNADHASFPWSFESYRAALDLMVVDCPVVAVSYDRPDLDIGDQIVVALASKHPRFGSAFLMKPPPGRRLIIEEVSESAAMLRHFDIIGVTEKEAGESFTERLSFVARLRALMDANGVDKPIHVFGGLDPFMTPLYFLAGADIVDGLTWLRMAFTEAGARYLPGFAAMSEPTARLEDAEWRIRRANFRRAIDMQNAMRRFLLSGDYAVLSADVAVRSAIHDAHQRLIESLRRQGLADAIR
jgi:hypothetical protein